MTGCANKLVAVPIDVPQELLTCAAKPPPPGANATQRDVAKFIVRQDAVIDDCKGDLRSVDSVIRDFNKRASGTRLEDIKTNTGLM